MRAPDLEEAGAALPALGTGPTLGHVLWAAAGAVGVDIEATEPQAVTSSLSAARLLDLAPARKVCVVLVDGLGWHNLMERAELAPFLTRSGRLTRLTCAFPSTTATNMAFLGTGAAAGATGMLGYTVREPALGALLNLVSWRGGADPEDWQPRRTVFERMSDVARTAVSVGPWRFDASGLTLAALRGAQFQAAESLRDRVDAALSALEEPDVDLVYLYWGDLDSAGHHHGWRSAQWGQELTQLDTELERLARALPAGTTLLVTADHGMVDVPTHASAVFGGPARLDVAENEMLRRDVDLVAGEPRASHLYCRAGRAGAVRDAWRAELGERAWVLSRDEALRADLFGPVDERFLTVIGDVVVAVRGDLAVHDSRTQTAASLKLIGMHGSLTPAETTVPLLVVEA
ncbi:MAG: alkaline phosphatase family protein [Actinomycetales bacterium]|nr:alkaline phosphatase family protein [Actinomycetales bacterium]